MFFNARENFRSSSNIILGEPFSEKSALKKEKHRKKLIFFCVFDKKILTNLYKWHIIEKGSSPIMIIDELSFLLNSLKIPRECLARYLIIHL